MRSTSIVAFTAIIGASLLPSLASAHSNSGGLANHRRVLRRSADKVQVEQRGDGAWETYAEAVVKRGGNLSGETKKYKKRGGKTCRVRTPSAENASATATSTGAEGPTVIAAVLNPATATGTGNAAGGWGQNAGPETSLSSVWVEPTTTYSVPASSTPDAPAPTNNGGGIAGGILSAFDKTCGGCGSSAESPNGSPEWLNCGLYGAGWTPPHVTAKQLVAVDAHSHPEVFGACSQYADIFIDAANQYGVPATLLMAIGMQESGCDRNAQGARGEQGIMQVAGNACQGVADCKDPWYNIHRGANILVAEKLNGDIENGNIIQALGQYNGWMPGMQVGWGAQYGPSGQTIAYLDDMLNKWMQGKSAY